MSDSTYLGNNASSVTTSPEFGGYSKVVIHIDDETDIEVGNESARTLELDCPWGTPEMAQNILSSLSGYSYQPYNANGAILKAQRTVGPCSYLKGRCPTPYLVVV